MLGYSRNQREMGREKEPGFCYDPGPHSPSGERAKKHRVLLQIRISLTTFEERSS
jgi:hypothetical protein